jgi:hypothetical protein
MTINKSTDGDGRIVQIKDATLTMRILLGRGYGLDETTAGCSSCFLEMGTKIMPPKILLWNRRYNSTSPKYIIYMYTQMNCFLFRK